MTCEYWSQDGLFCYLHDAHSFGNAINIVSAILSLVAVIFEIIILFFVKDLELYGSDTILFPNPIEMQPMNSPENTEETGNSFL